MVLQDLLASGDVQRDASGNPILKDSGVWLKNEIKSHYKDADIKYIDPSYLIRSIPTTSVDRIYCKASPCMPVVHWGPQRQLPKRLETRSTDEACCLLQILAHNAVHAAFAGYTGVVTGLVNTHYVLLPIPVVISSPRRVRRGSADRFLALKPDVHHDRVSCPVGTHNQILQHRWRLL